ncbi:heterokaryon incompatibility protein-domain-containing protein [Xylaria arbuscula]|nr:heterokaryon incompatibility protein-domain-containing protein [Xylaria arbuscula]
MSTQISMSSSRLCIFCRRIESTSHPCSRRQGADTLLGQDPLQPDITDHFSDEEAAMLKDLKAQPSSLCYRCSTYDVAGAFKHAEPFDGQLQAELSNQDDPEYRQRVSQYEIRLGKLSSLFLTPSCQFCRLIYRILPKGLIEPENDTLSMVPVRSYLRTPGWNVLTTDLRSKCAVFLCIYVPSISPLLYSYSAGDPVVRVQEINGAAIALRSSQTSPDRSYFNARVIEDIVDYSSIKEAIKVCESTHGDRCQTTWPAEMSTTRMLDIADRKIIACPDKCDYVALSYVWGGVIPAADALEKGTLPRTIEDAIIVTQNLGRRYLWVDALCIDQRPTLTSDEARAKQEQLGIMHLIYKSAAITIVALSGDNSNWGLAGVSPAAKRPYQVQETINGHELFTVAPQHNAEQAMSVWDTRAWTFQEAVFSRRALYIANNQVHFECGEFSIAESDDVNTYPPNHRTFKNLKKSIASIRGFLPDAGTIAPFNIYAGFVKAYTSRRMTNEEDSINAGLGVLTDMEKQLFKKGLVYGLPLRSHPQSLGWMHEGNNSPKRRSAFPSWTWAGWEGEVCFPQLLFRQFAEDRKYHNIREDLMVLLLGVNGAEITVECFVVKLDIRTNQFIVVFGAGGREAIGSVIATDHLTKTTLPSGIYDCVIVQRLLYQKAENIPEKEQVCLLFPDWQGTVAKRKTLGILSNFEGGSVMQAKPERKTIKMI